MNKLQVASLLMIPVMFGLVAAPAGVAASTASYLEYLQAIWSAQSATSQYHDVDNAIADGYVSTHECVEHPELGAMGIHYVKPALLGDIEATEETPEVLVYQPTDTGLRLVAVEYIVTALADTDQGPQPWFGDSPPPGGWVNEAPELYGRHMHGPHPAPQEGQPWQYSMHAWLWQPNPAGLFTDFNPAVSCP